MGMGRKSRSARLPSFVALAHAAMASPCSTSSGPRIGMGSKLGPSIHRSHKTRRGVPSEAGESRNRPIASAYATEEGVGREGSPDVAVGADVAIVSQHVILVGPQGHGPNLVVR